jgi:hypothetical protein
MQATGERSASWQQRIVRAFVRQLDKIPGSNGGLIGNQNRTGKWRVVYPDGQRSQRFYYDTAKAYAKMFDGKVTHARYESANDKLTCGERSEPLGAAHGSAPNGGKP